MKFVRETLKGGGGGNIAFVELWILCDKFEEPSVDQRLQVDPHVLIRHVCKKCGPSLPFDWDSLLWLFSFIPIFPDSCQNCFALWAGFIEMQNP